LSPAVQNVATQTELLAEAQPNFERAQLKIDLALAANEEQNASDRTLTRIVVL